MSQAQSQGVTLAWLPNELLISIVQESVKIKVIPDSKHSKLSSFKQCDSSTAAALALTSRHFHHLATPLLYSEIEIQCHGACRDKYKEIRMTRHLHRTFLENPSLRTHCKRLDIEFGSSRPNLQIERPSRGTHLFRIAFDFLKWLTNIEELRIAGWPQNPHPLDWENRGLAALAPTRGDYRQLLDIASEHLTSLRHLELATHCGANIDLPVLHAALVGLDINACLRTLDISGISSFGSRRDWELLKTRAGTAPFTELKLRDFDACASALEALVMWPAKLTSFQFAFVRIPRFSFSHTLVTYNLQSILSHQKDSLTFIRMDQIPDQRLENFNMAKFRSLKVLWLARDLTGTDPEFVANLLAPNLDVFHWNLVPEDQDERKSLDAFQKPEEDWLRAFAAAAIASNSTLRHINIRFSPQDYIQLEDKWDLEYPWDRMDRIASEIQPHGIRLSYSPINVSRERFNALARIQVRVPKHLNSSWQLKELHLSDGYSSPPSPGDPPSAGGGQEKLLLIAFVLHSISSQSDGSF